MTDSVADRYSGGGGVCSGSTPVSLVDEVDLGSDGAAGVVATQPRRRPAPQAGCLGGIPAGPTTLNGNEGIAFRRASFPSVW